MRSRRPVSVVVRYDEYAAEFGVDMDRLITVVKVLDDPSEADREAARLNELNGHKGCRYWSQVTRLLSTGDAHAYDDDGS
jgi:hypothetical protein